MSKSINQDFLESVMTLKQESLCKTHPMFFPTDFVLDDARFCAKLVNYAYNQCNEWYQQGCPPKDQFKWTVPSDIAGSYLLWLSGLGTSCFNEPIGFVYCDSDGRVFVSFRGTITQSDAWADGVAIQYEYQIEGKNFGDVHFGFLAIYGLISNSLLDALKKVNSAVGTIRKIYFTGHSLGAALCTLALPDVIYNFAKKITPESKQPQQFLLYNFASPRVGNSQFACSINSLSNSQLYRIVNTEDVVTTIPPSTMVMTKDIVTTMPPSTRDMTEGIVTTVPFSTAGFNYTYEHIGQQITFTAQYLSVSANHSMADCYTYAINHPNQPQKEEQLTVSDKPVLVLSKALAENFSVSVVNADSPATEA